MSAPFHSANQRNGSVLVVVLCVCLGLVSITLLFGHSMLMAYRGADNDLSGRQAEQAIDGAARYVELLMATAETPGLMPDITSYESEAVPVGDATFWFLGRAAETTTNGTTRVFGLVDEASKINLNMRVSDPQIFLDILGKLPGMTAELAAAIIDWRDADEDVTPGGAEAETYNRQTPASSAKNADFESVEELGLVSGATRLILYGEDTNLNGVLDANEDDGETNLPSDNSDGKLDPGILEYLTVFSKESNKQSDGTTARINVTQPGTELTTLL
ncbi:MAG: comEA protein, partial [Chthoniobacteraceae bacterium]|nr:comEA protein [Chthoniobacteraceae bacterium]